MSDPPKNLSNSSTVIPFVLILTSTLTLILLH